MTCRWPPVWWRLLASALVVLVAACGGGSGPAAPTLVIASDVSGTAIGAVTFTFTFSEDVDASFTADDIVVTNGIKGTFTRLGATQYSLVVTPPVGSTGNMGVSVAADAYRSVDNVPGAAMATATQPFDTAPPTLTISSSSAGAIATRSVTLTFTFSEDVGTSFTASSVQITFSSGSGGSIETFTRVSGTQATLVVTPPAQAAGTIEISVPIGAFTDLAGNGSTKSYFAAQKYDTR